MSDSPTPFSETEILSIQHLSEWLAYQNPWDEKANYARGLLEMIERHHPELSAEAFAQRMKKRVG